MGIYTAHQGQIAGNEEAINSWIKKIDELSKTALPGEKIALENTKKELEGLRQEVEINIQPGKGDGSL